MQTSRKAVTRCALEKNDASLAWPSLVKVVTNESFWLESLQMGLAKISDRSASPAGVAQISPRKVIHGDARNTSSYGI